MHLAYISTYICICTYVCVYTSISTLVNYYCTLPTAAACISRLFTSTRKKSIKREPLVAYMYVWLKHIHIPTCM